MTTMISELYDALKEAGASEEKARRAAEAIAGYESRFADIRHDIANVRSELKQDIANVRGELKQDIERTNGCINTLTWMVGTNIALTVAILGKLLRIYWAGWLCRFITPACGDPALYRRLVLRQILIREKHHGRRIDAGHPEPEHTAVHEKRFANSEPAALRCDEPRYGG